MYELTVIKHSGGLYIDSRETAEFVGKKHGSLLREIDGYMKIFGKSDVLKNEGVNFFIRTCYTDAKGETRPFYLISKIGCELIAPAFTGEKGILFTTAYITKFSQVEAAEREAEIKAQAKPRLSEFNSAARNMLAGMAQCSVNPESVMKFLSGVYESLGIDVLPFDDKDICSYISATEIAACLGVYSETGKPHGRAVSAIISKLNCHEYCTIAVPYGLVGVSLRYDKNVAETVKNWLLENNCPREISHQGFNYRLYYNKDRKIPSEDYNIEIFIKL